MTKYTKWNTKNKFSKIYAIHPCDVYESDNMSMVNLPNIKNIESKLKLKTSSGESENEINLGNNNISNVQMEAILHALHIMYNKECLENDCRGFLLGDGTGVGKTRIICSILSELYMNNMSSYRVLWVSTNMSLEEDAICELNIVKDLGNLCPDWLKINDLKNKKDGIHFTTYSSFVREKNLKIIKNWLHATSNFVLVFDEAHSAKNCKSKCGQAVVHLQRYLNNPRVIYSTATAASDIKQLHYAEKLGLWKDYGEFVYLLEKYGSTAMEMCALQLKHCGKLVCRQLGYDNIKIELKSCILNNKEEDYYNLLNTEWCKLNVANGIDNLNFYQHLLTSFKMKTVIQEIYKSLEQNESIVIGIQSTGEIASTKRSNYSCIYDLFSRHNRNMENYLTAGITFPYNPIDLLISEFGSDNVSEISGRKYRPLLSENKILEKVPNIKKEINDFKNDIKRIAIITKCGSSGISLHSNNNIENVRKRHHIVLESPRTAELLIQQFGRTNRANSRCSPYYTILMTNVPSELRFFNGLTSKMMKLGALTKGDKSFSLLHNKKFEGCCFISSKVYKSFILELNIQISLNWFFKQNYETYALTKMQNGLESLEYYMYSDEKRILFFAKVLSNLNDHLLNPIEVPNDFKGHPIMLKYSSRDWSYIWLDLFRGYKFRLSYKVIYYMFSSIWSTIVEYLPNTKSLLYLDNEWMPNNHKLQSNYIKCIVNTILLCKIRPECKNTLGMLPTHLIHEIIPYFMPCNRLKKANWNKVSTCFQNGENKLNKDGITNFLNKMLKFPILMQNAILPILRNNSYLESNLENSSIKSIESHVFKTSVNCKKFKIVYKSFSHTNSSSWYELQISAKQKLTLQNHIDRYSELKKKLLKFVKFKNNATKFGMVVYYDESNKYELWYPGNAYPSRSFVDFQWETESANYNKVDITDDKWIDQLKKVYSYNQKLLKAFNLKLTFSLNNCIDIWKDSLKKLICIKNTKICPDFVGLLYDQARII